MNYDHFSRLVDNLFLVDAADFAADGTAAKALVGCHHAEPFDAKTLNPLVAAYIGDAYYSLYIRLRLLDFERDKVRVLNEFSADFVSAQKQAAVYRAIEPMLDEAEKEIFRHGRNAHSHAPRKASVADYHASTGFEALLGILFLTKNFQRLTEIAEAAFQALAAQTAKIKPPPPKAKKQEISFSENGE